MYTGLVVRNASLRQGIVTHRSNPNNEEAEAGGNLEDTGETISLKIRKNKADVSFRKRTWTIGQTKLAFIF